MELTPNPLCAAVHLALAHQARKNVGAAFAARFGRLPMGDASIIHACSSCGFDILPAQKRARRWDDGWEHTPSCPKLRLA